LLLQKLKAEVLPQKKSEYIHLGRSSGSKRSAPETSSSHVIKQARTATSTGGIVLDYDDFTLMENVHVGQQHFLITDPWMRDNPIVFASGGFYELTGYTPSEVLGRNCRFMQGKDSDPEAIKEIREGIDKGEDVHCIVRNYKKDGTPFWNDLFIAPLRGEDGSVVHFLGVQCAISEERATRLLDAKARISGCSP
jgi:PAS domain S-box-containing protein